MTILQILKGYLLLGFILTAIVRGTIQLVRWRIIINEVGNGNASKYYNVAKKYYMELGIVGAIAYLIGFIMDSITWPITVPLVVVGFISNMEMFKYLLNVNFKETTGEEKA